MTPDTGDGHAGTFPLDPVEIAFGSPLGLEPSAPPIRIGGDPRIALDDLLRDALLRPPCVVAFSGGRDSSVVLAAATALARREGLPLPVPFSLRFPDDPDAEESDWQERVIRYLDLNDWERADPGHSLDFVGPVARHVLDRLGQIWPANSHFVVPAMAGAVGGSVVTGAFGDEIFTEDGGRTRLRAIRYGGARPALMDLARLAVTTGPRMIRRAAAVRRLRGLPTPGWLRPEATELVRARIARQLAAAPLRWDRSAVLFPRLRYALAGMATLRAIGDLHGVAVMAPLGDARFVAAVAAEAGPSGFPDRSAAMRRLFGDLLPEAILTRTSKASFRRAFWGPETAAFARAWASDGLSAGLVDADVLRRTWADAADATRALPAFAFQSATALQAAYLAS